MDQGLDQEHQSHLQCRLTNIKMEDLTATAQTSFDKMLHYTVPSFNSTQQTVSDATAHFDPADLRGFGPSRTLV